jgi:hypothetical protein
VPIARLILIPEREATKPARLETPRSKSTWLTILDSPEKPWVPMAFYWINHRICIWIRGDLYAKNSVYDFSPNVLGIYWDWNKERHFTFESTGVWPTPGSSWFGLLQLKPQPLHPNPHKLTVAWYLHTSNFSLPIFPPVIGRWGFQLFNTSCYSLDGSHVTQICKDSLL